MRTVPRRLHLRQDVAVPGALVNYVDPDGRFHQQSPKVPAVERAGGTETPRRGANARVEENCTELNAEPRAARVVALDFDDTPDQIETAHHREPPPPPPPPRRSDHPPTPPPRRSDHPPLRRPASSSASTVIAVPRPTTPTPTPTASTSTSASSLVFLVRHVGKRERLSCGADSPRHRPVERHRCPSSRPRARSISGTTRTRPTSRIRRFAPSRFSSRDTASTARRGFGRIVECTPDPTRARFVRHVHRRAPRGALESPTRGRVETASLQLFSTAKS